MRRRNLLAAVTLTLAGLAAPLAAGADVLVVLNKSDHDAALVDPNTYQVLAKLPTGNGPHEAAASPDGRFAYVTNYGTQGNPGNTLTVLDLKNRQVKATFHLGEYTRPHGIHVSRDGSRLWVTCEGAQAVLELDAHSGEILHAWKTNQQVSHMVVPTPDEKKLYVANISSGSVSVIDRQTNQVKTIPTGRGAEGIDVSPDGEEVWVANRGDNTLSIIATATDQVIATFESGGQIPIRVKFTPDGRQVWISNARSNAVTVFDAQSRQLIDTIDVGAIQVGILMQPDGQRAFVANTRDDRVTIIDVPARRVLQTFSTGDEPDGMAWAD
ncbi:beta-propeller fold lactonase family protein [Acidobacteriia bacterium AH_259_A11_L15]|nr:beta-propeller fold lactonase family protein [Acidobacteriia bacterium AH_259_A11_L15]